MHSGEEKATTRCPHCGMRFRVSPSQLEAAHGAVRCGACKQIFDARAQLSGDDDTGPGKGPRLAQISAQLSDEPIELPAPRRRPVWQTLALSGLCLLLVMAAVVQVRFWKLDQLRVHPLAGPRLEFICQRIACPPPSRNDLDSLASEGLIVRTHPGYDDALAIDLRLVNRARFSQPWPDLEFVFSDLEGKPVAARRFHGREYLADEQAAELLAAGSRARIHLDVRDPGADASSYVVRFLPASSGAF